MCFDYFGSMKKNVDGLENKTAAVIHLHLIVYRGTIPKLWLINNYL